MSEEEIIVNLKTEIETYAIPKTSLDNSVTNGNNPVKSSGIKSYVEEIINTLKTSYIPTQLQNYLKISDANGTYLKKTDANNTYLKKIGENSADDTYLKISDAETTYAPIEHSHEIDVNMYAQPIETNTKINNLTDSGYFLYTGTDASFTCSPDTIHYTNGYIRVEKQGTHIIQHVFATSYSTANQQYNIDGREFVRHGYLTDSSINWEHWRIVNIPWKERNDLLQTKGTYVSDNGFKIYECTAGYVFKWEQSGQDKKYVLSAPQYEYASVYTFNTELPIISPYIFGNLMGHMDIKITSTEFKVRSVNKAGEYLSNVDVAFFVPRTN